MLVSWDLSKNRERQRTPALSASLKACNLALEAQFPPPGLWVEDKPGPRSEGEGLLLKALRVAAVLPWGRTPRTGTWQGLMTRSQVLPQRCAVTSGHVLTHGDLPLTWLFSLYFSVLFLKHLEIL